MGNCSEVPYCTKHQQHPARPCRTPHLALVTACAPGPRPPAWPSAPAPLAPECRPHSRRARQRLGAGRQAPARAHPLASYSLLAGPSRRTRRLAAFQVFAFLTRGFKDARNRSFRAVSRMRGSRV